MVSLEKLYFDLRPLRPGSVNAYLATAAIVAAATVLRLGLTPWVAGVQFVSFFPAVILTTFICGAAAGYFAVFLSALSAWFFIVMPNATLEQAALATALFVVPAVADVVIIGALRGAAARVRQLNVTLRDSEARFRGLLESAPDAMVIADKQGRITLVNAQTERLFGYPREELLGQPVEMLMLERDRGQHPGRVAAFMARPTARPMGAGLNLHGVSKDGREFPIEISLGPVPTAEGILVSAAIRDSTARQKAEAELAEAKRVAETASRAKSEFLSSMSHELRTPLNAVIGFAELLMMDRGGTLTVKQKDYAGHIIDGANHLVELVNEVLDLAGIEAGRLRLSIKRVSVRNALEHVQRTMLPLAQKTGVTLELKVPAELGDVRADELRLQQVLINLVSNAIKYNRPDGVVALTGRSMASGRVRFVVTDTGIGIAPERVKDLFQPFQRLGAEHSRIEGTGIGLALSRRLVDAMHGAIGFTSEPGHGSTFWIDLPAEAKSIGTADLGEATSSPSRATAGGYSLLYVEDNPSNIHLMEQLIATLPDVALLAAPTPQLGIDLAVAHRPNAIVLDLNLPGMSGFDVLARLKAMPETRDIPVLALTAAAFPRDIKKGLAAGFFRSLPKPIDVNALLAAVDDALTASSVLRA
jgi:PAS domain S-box-containing protein